MSRALLEMQRDFLSSLRKQSGTQIETALVKKRISDAGLNAYLHAYSSRLSEALDNDHPVLGTYLGDELWHRMTTGYLEKHPSKFRSLRNFGDLLPEYLLGSDEFKMYPEIVELAKLERSFLDCFDALDAQCVEFSEFLKLPPEQWASLGLMFHPSVQMLDQDFNTMAIWQCIKEQQPPPALVKNKNIWLLWRDADRITNFRSLNSDEHTAFSHFKNNGNFAGLCETLARAYPVDSVPNLAIGFLKSWSEQGLISVIIVD